jgi:hypothetical protein
VAGWPALEQNQGGLRLIIMAMARAGRRPKGCQMKITLTKERETSAQEAPVSRLRIYIKSHIFCRLIILTLLVHKSQLFVEQNEFLLAFPRKRAVEMRQFVCACPLL